MIKKRIYYLVVNGSDDAPPSMEAYDVLSPDEVRLYVAHELRSPTPYVRILSQRDQFLSVFSILDYIAQADVSVSPSSFTSFVNEVGRYIQSIPIHELFWIWISQFDPSMITQQRKEVETILETYQLPFSYDDLTPLRADWDAQMQERMAMMESEYDEVLDVYRNIYEHQCDANDILPFVIRKTRVKFELVYDHSLYYMMDTLALNGEWRIAMYKDLVRYHPSVHASIHETYDQEYVAMLQERLEERGTEEDIDTLMILHRDLEQVIKIQYQGPSTTTPFRYELVMDVTPFDEIGPMRDVLTEMIGQAPSQHYETISISGNFYIKNVAFQKLLFQDFVMNDPIASRLTYVNELEKAYRHGENVTLHLGNRLTAILINRQNDSTPVPTSLSYFQGNYVKVNVIRATGSQTNTNVVVQFQEIVCALLHRFMRSYESYQTLYFDTIPNMPAFPILTSDETVKEIRNFADKYKNIFKHTGYKTSCRPKTRMPSIISETEARTLNPLKVIQFPKPNDPKLDIPSEYLTCDDPAYPFPGIASLGGGDLFVPCCFNKNPRSSRAFLEYYQGIKTAEPKGTEHVKSESQIIKTFGDVGRLPPAIHQFLIAIRPDMTFLRAGTMDTSSSILHSLSYMTGKTEVPVSDATARREFASYFGSNVTVCLGENVGMTVQDIQKDLADVSSPFDPRRYLRLLEIFYDVNLIIFTRTKKREDFEILTPYYRQFYLRYDFDPSKPFVFLYEHWGTSPDRYTKRLHPVYEMIVSPRVGIDRPQTTFELNAPQRSILSKVYRTLFYVYPLGQNVPLLPITNRVRGQLVDDQGKLRTLIVERKGSPKRYFRMEAIHPLPTLYIPNEMVVDTAHLEEMRKSLPSVEEILEASPLPRPRVVTYLRYRQQYYVVLAFSRTNTNNDAEHQFKVAIKALPSTVDRISVPTTRDPVMTMVPTLSQPPSIDLVRKQRLARVLMDYVLYLYASFYYDETDEGTSNDDYDKFFRKHTMVVPEYEYPQEMSERVEENPMVMESSTNTLILDSPTLQRKLTFVLKYHRLYDSPSLATYKGLKILPNFWRTPYDFGSWKEMQSISNFERFVRSGHIPPYHVDRLPLSELSKDQGYWYNHDERPIKAWGCPFRYVRIESSDETIPLSLYWKKYRSVPPYRVTDPVSSTNNVRIMQYNDAIEGWTPPEIDMTMEIPVFQVQNRNGQLFVLLEMKN